MRIKPVEKKQAAPQAREGTGIMSKTVARGTVVFDMIGTCFSLNRVADALTQAGAPNHALPLWFAQSLRDAVSLSHAGGYQPLKSVLEAELPRTLQQLKVTTAPDQIRQIAAAFGQLEPQPGLTELVAGLAADNWRILALTNSSVDSVKNLLERAGIARHFAALLSTDQVQKMKPHPAVYEMARQKAEGETWMIAAHAWDIQGAARVGFRTIFISGLETAYLEIYPRPDAIVKELAEVKAALTQTASR
jgi:2-haloacid dehalogenase